MSFIREFTRFLDREPEAKGVENAQSSEGEPAHAEYVQDPMI